MILKLTLFILLTNALIANPWNDPLPGHNIFEDTDFDPFEEITDQPEPGKDVQEEPIKMPWLIKPEVPEFDDGDNYDYIQEEEKTNLFLAFLENENEFRSNTNFLELTDAQSIILQKWIEVVEGYLKGFDIQVTRAELEKCPLLKENFLLAIEDTVKMIIEIYDSWSTVFSKASPIVTNFEIIAQGEILDYSCTNNAHFQKFNEFVEKMKVARKRDMLWNTVKNFSDIADLANKSSYALLLLDAHSFGDCAAKIVRYVFNF